MQPTQVFLPGQSHRQRSLAGYSPWGRKELDTTEQLTFITALFNIGWRPVSAHETLLSFSWLVLKRKRRVDKLEGLTVEGRTGLSYLHHWKTIMDEDGAENLCLHFDSYSIFFPSKTFYCV